MHSSLAALRRERDALERDAEIRPFLASEDETASSSHSLLELSHGVRVSRKLQKLGKIREKIQKLEDKKRNTGKPQRWGGGGVGLIRMLKARKEEKTATSEKSMTKKSKSSKSKSKAKPSESLQSED